MRGGARWRTGQRTVDRAEKGPPDVLCPSKPVPVIVAHSVAVHESPLAPVPLHADPALTSIGLKASSAGKSPRNPYFSERS